MKSLLVALSVLVAGGAARAEVVNCEAIKSSYEPYQVIRTIHVNDVPSMDHTSVYRDQSGQAVVLSTLADGGSSSKTTSLGMFALLKEDLSNKAATVRFEYSGIDPKTFRLDQSATYRLTHVTAAGQRVSVTIDHRFVGRKTYALEGCQFDVVQYSSRITGPDGHGVSFSEEEYSPDLKLVLASKTQIEAGDKGMSITIAAQRLVVGVANFIPVGKAAQSSTGSPQPGPVASAPAEFFLGTQWKYLQSAVAPGRILAHGQADVVDKSGGMLGGVGYYCAIPHPYIDIFIHKPGGVLSEYYWGNATLKTGLTLNGAALAAQVENGIVYVDINDDVRAVLERAFEPGAGTTDRRLNFDVAKFATFALTMKAQAVPQTANGISFARMEALCAASVAAQGRGQ